MSGIEALNLLFEGKVLEAGQRYYRLNDNEMQYSDDMKEWSKSTITINDFLKWIDWRLIK